MESATPSSGNAPGPPSPTVGPQGYEDPSPLQIPELLIRIGRYLDQPSLLSSQLVCREWHKTLVPLVWTDLKLVQHGPHFMDPVTDDFIRQNAPHVKRLFIEVDPQQYERFFGNLDDDLCLRTVVFPKLTSLEMKIQQKSYWGSQTREMEYLTSNLLRLMLKSSSLGNGGGEGLRALQVLKIESFHFQYMPRDWMTLWETLWSRLQVLSLEGMWWETYQIFEEEEDEELDVSNNESVKKERARSDETCNFDKMEKLAKRLGPSLTMRDLTLIDKCGSNRALYEIQKWMVLQCPKLVRLEWRTDYDKQMGVSVLAMMRNAIERGRQKNPPQFQELETLALLVPGFLPTDFARLVETMPRLTELKMDGVTAFRGNSWDVLRNSTPRHLETLRVVDVKGCGIGPMALHDILCSLPHLEDIRGDVLEDVILRRDTRPWACKKTLKRLCVDFQVSSQRRLLSQTLFISRVAELEQLEDLMVAYSDLRLDLSKPKGMLDGLKGLKRLKSFAFNTRQMNAIQCDWGLAEVAWARENWPDLKNVDMVVYKDEVPEADKYPANF